jgi:hypothetical protein
MTDFDERPAQGGEAEGSEGTPPDRYLMHPLPTLDGVLIYVTRRGEHVGTYFGPTERAAAAAVAEDLADIVSARIGEPGA